MNKFSALFLLLLSGLVSAAGKPNIVVIMTDNQGFGDLGSYGGVRAETPRIDQLASEGIRFQDFQVEPGCTPTRAAFQTGRMPVRSGTDGYVEPGQPGGLHPKEVTIAEMLKDVGYSTAMFGQWHHGDGEDIQLQMHDYDEWYGITNKSEPVDPVFPGSSSVSFVQQTILNRPHGNMSMPVA